jgi:hypothetical protein
MRFESRLPSLQFVARACVAVAGIAVCIGTGCSKATSPKGGSGTITGNVSVIGGGGLDSVTVAIIPDTGAELTATTDAKGNFVASGVAPGQGSIEVFTAPFGCIGQPATTYNLPPSGSVTENLFVTCSP